MPQLRPGSRWPSSTQPRFLPASPTESVAQTGSRRARPQLATHPAPPARSPGWVEPGAEAMVAIVDFLRSGHFVTPTGLFGFRDRRLLLQVEAETIRLRRLCEKERARCGVCSKPHAFAPVGSPCPSCHGAMVRWPDADLNATEPSDGSSHHISSLSSPASTPPRCPMPIVSIWRPASRRRPISPR